MVAIGETDQGMRQVTIIKAGLKACDSWILIIHCQVKTDVNIQG